MIRTDGQDILEKKNVTMISFHNYKATVRNKDTSMGQYYPEDDWSVTAYGETLDELFQNLAIEFFTPRDGSVIYPERFKFEIVNVISFIDETTGATVFQTENAQPIKSFDNEEKHKITQQFYDSKYYVEAKADWEKRLREETIRRNQKAQAEREEQEKKQLAALLKKYPDVTPE